MTKKEKEALFDLLHKVIRRDARHIPDEDGSGADTAENIRILCKLYDKQTGHNNTFEFLANGKGD